MFDNETLHSIHTLVTRPIDLAEQLCNDIEALGGTVSRFPVLEISEIRDPAQEEIFEEIDTFDIIIFISPTAVKYFASRAHPTTKLTASIAAIGQSTASALDELGLQVFIHPEGNDSEALLRHEDLQVNNVRDKRLLIIKGEGGRTLLRDTLKDRGADVEELMLYRRTIPAHYKALDTKDIDKIDIILTSSGEGINNLYDMTKDKSSLIDTPTIVPGKRCEQIARELGFSKVIVARDATNDSMVSAVIDYSTRHGL